VEELKQHLETLRADLDVEIDLHGGRTTLAFNLRQAIIQVEKELEQHKKADTNALQWLTNTIVRGNGF
jgi:hypothetical protein